jgi:hypothetical protein
MPLEVQEQQRSAPPEKIRYEENPGAEVGPPAMRRSETRHLLPAKMMQESIQLGKPSVIAFPQASLMIEASELFYCDLLESRRRPRPTSRLSCHGCGCDGLSRASGCVSRYDKLNSKRLPEPESKK